MEALLFGSAATASSAATAGLFGMGGSFALMPTLSTVGTAVSAMGAMQQGSSAQAAARYNAGVLEQNASIERANAGQREEAQRRQARQILGEQRASFAQAGIGLDGSAADVMAQSARDAELDALTLRYEGDMRARGMLANAEGERFSGRSAKRAGYLGAAGSILSGAASYGTYQANQRLREYQLGKIS